MFPDKILVHRSESNSATLTFDGVDKMGERLANEVLGVVKHRSGLKKISFVAHSLGSNAGGVRGNRTFRNGHFNTGGANGYSREMRKVPAMENPLPVSLEDMYKGVVKKMPITRNVYDASGLVLVDLVEE
ncbi:hypothetical protein ISN45_At01g053560 [Arabidopsis thaliana x Arabidopsis arenosa]|uniref:DUF676 domain-containing protein n=1 Tax=Arabidopsis thaliana x Arabidopsis arenosa TaxID=1240361 RepID=A0A8T2GSX2_9BRAS|nr:hypothetical protein ISN45_At01g053560 [Arabidopsis thaliana x Arabidopsis arenosa]